MKIREIRKMTAIMITAILLAGAGFMGSAFAEAPEMDAAAIAAEQEEAERAAREAAEREAAEKAAREAAEREAAEKAAREAAEREAAEKAAQEAAEREAAEKAAQEAAEREAAEKAAQEAAEREAAEKAAREAAEQEAAEKAAREAAEEAKPVENAENVEAEAAEENETIEAREPEAEQAAEPVNAAAQGNEETGDSDEDEEEEEEETEEEEEAFEEFEEEEEILEIEDYETPMGAAAFQYKYKKVNGRLVLDENGDPIAILEKGQDIPKAWLRDAAGSLILDRNGNPVAIQTVPADAVYVQTIHDVLDENRSIDIYVSFTSEDAQVGAKATFVAVLNGYEEVVYDLQWQESKDGIHWENLASTAARMELETSEDNMHDFWRVQVTVKGIA